MPYRKNETEVIPMMPECSFCKLEIFLPESHLGAVQRALAEVDAGHIGRGYQSLDGDLRALGARIRRLEGGKS